MKPNLQSVPSEWTEESNGAAAEAASSPDQAGGSTGAPPASGGGAGRAPGKARPERSVPTDRMRFEKQVLALQTYAQLSGRNKQPVAADYLGKALEMSPSTAGLCGGFFKDSGWLERTGRAYAATDPLLEYQRRINLDPEDAAAVSYLADAARNSWYWEAVEPMLGNGVRLNMLLVTLSQSANAHDHKPQLLLLIEWMAWLQLVRRDGDMVYPAADGISVAEAPEASEGAEEVEGVAEVAGGHSGIPSEREGGSDSASASAPDRVSRPSGAASALDPDALVSFNFSVRITAEDAAKLSPENIASLLQVVEKLRG